MAQKVAVLADESVCARPFGVCGNKGIGFFEAHYFVFEAKFKWDKKSSSIVVKRLINLIKVWNSLGSRFDLTSSTIVRHILTECDDRLSARKSRMDSQLSFLTNPKPKIYTLASRMSRKLTLPELLSDLPHMFDDFFFAHSGKRRRPFGYAFTKFMQEFFCFCFFRFHRASPLSKFTMKSGYCQILASLILMMAAVVPFAYAETSIINIYDANGSLVTGDGRYYEYNDANQLVRVRQGETIAGPVIAEYFYDFSGQRVMKIENGVVTYYVGKHFEKQVGGATAGSTSYYFGDGSERVAKKDPAGNIFYYHLDHLDGINVVTDSAGNTVARTDYLPFGDVRAGSSGSEKYSYTGKELDKTNLYYFEARYNSPEFRHFTQADIAEPDYGDPQDLNRYSYVGNNPLSYVDPDGFKKKKKAKLSKREKWMIAHGSDPDKDKTSLKKAKEQHKAGKKYTTASATYSSAGKPKYNLAGVGAVQGRISTGANDIQSSGSRPDKDWCGSGKFNVPDHLWGVNMSPSCEGHDNRFDKWGTGLVYANTHLGSGIILGNQESAKAKLIGYTYATVTNTVAIIPYIPAQYAAGDREGKSKWETTKMLLYVNLDYSWLFSD